MGCFFSSPSNEDKTRHRIAPHQPDQQSSNPEEPLIPPPDLLTASTSTVSMRAPGSVASPGSFSKGNAQIVGSRILGASVTDIRLRQQPHFSQFVQQARQSFLPLSSFTSPRVTPLSVSALQLTRDCEPLLSDEIVPNLPNGFFAEKLPYSIFTKPPVSEFSLQIGPSAADIVNTMLATPSPDLTELAFACAQFSCLALSNGSTPPVQDVLLITLAEFEEA